MARLLLLGVLLSGFVGCGGPKYDEEPAGTKATVTTGPDGKPSAKSGQFDMTADSN